MRSTRGEADKVIIVIVIIVMLLWLLYLIFFQGRVT